MNRPRLHTCFVFNNERGSVLIIVMWVCFGLVALVLYFAQSTSAELRAADNRFVAAAAEAAVEGGARYVQYVLGQSATNGARPLSTDYEAEAVPVGDATFWIIGRDPNELPTTEPVFNLVDESSKLNLNKATLNQLLSLPGMTPEFAAAIIDWRDTDFSPTANGAEDETYARLDPPRRAKNAPFESVDELRLVYGATLSLLFGEDANRNGALDANEDDAETTAPLDDHDGTLLRGILDYVTVYSAEPAVMSDGTRRADLRNPSPQVRAKVRAVLTGKLSASRADQIMAVLPDGVPGPSVAEFMFRAKAAASLTETEFQQIHTSLTATYDPVRALVNVNTASEAVLACFFLPDEVQKIVAYRLSNQESLTSFYWLTQVTTEARMQQIGGYLTDQSYQFSADIAGVGPNGRGYSRVKYVFDTSKTTPRIIYRQDLTGSGWALGTQVRDSLRQNQYTSR